MSRDHEAIELATYIRAVVSVVLVTYHGDQDVYHD